MGIGPLGGADVIHKRKFRWTFKVYRSVGNNGSMGQPLVPEHFVKVASRPNISIEETEINFLHGKSYLPGKGTWETITVTYYDVSSAVGQGANIGLWEWLASVYDFTKPGTLYQTTTRNGYAGVGVLDMYDGCGKSLETWTLGDMWPQAINFGELDYSSSEECTIEVTLRYGNVGYRNNCGPNPQAECYGCG